MIRRVTLAEMQGRAQQAGAALAAQQGLLESYRSAALAGDETRVGLVRPDRLVLQPAVCAVDGTGAVHDAIVAYVTEWQAAHRREVQASLAERGDPRAVALTEGPDTGRLVAVPDLDERFAAAAGFDRYRDLVFARALGATRGQAAALIAVGIADEAAYAAFDAEYPYEIILQCGLGGRHAAITPCFAGTNDGGNTQLELRTPDRYALYQFFELNAAGTEVPGEGLKIPVKRPFSLRAQNADARLTLTVKVVEKRSGRVLFIKSVGQSGVISAGF